MKTMRLHAGTRTLVRRLALLCLLAPAMALAAPVRLGGTTVEVPAPVGFVAVVPGMTAVSAFQHHFVPPGNVQFALFIDEADVPEALAGGIPELERRFAVQTAKALVDRRITQSDFAGIKRAFASNNEALYAELRKKLPGLLADASKGVSEQLDTRVMINIGGIVPLPPHHEDERSMSASMIARNEVAAGGGETLVEVIAATMTFVHVNDRVLFLYAYANRDDLEWTRQRSRAWAEAIIEANAGTPAGHEGT
ncbi:MAG: hypothetical protein GX856_13075 [Gammaproteobacteria bacterium]|jgi:hypothetical protein|nr:hypothetical protein [Gammaproteobacteria bacterium]